MVKIAVDAMGGDHAPEAQVQGSILALERRSDLEVILAGNVNRLNELLRSIHPTLLKRLSIEPAPDLIPMKLTERDVMRAVAKDRKASWQTSIARATQVLEQADADAMVSSGNTPATWATSKAILGIIEGIEMGALVATLPTHGEQPFVALGDVGLAPDRSAYQTAEAMLLTGAYARHAFNLDGNVRMGTMSNGKEDGKGNAHTKEVDALLRSAAVPGYMGNVEAADCFAGNVDAVGMDGFVGNIALKWIEGSARYISDLQKKEVRSDWKPIQILNWLINREKWKRIKERVSPSENSAAPFVGLKKMVFKAHGSADRGTFSSAILQAARLSETDVLYELQNELPLLVERLKQKS